MMLFEENSNLGPIFDFIKYVWATHERTSERQFGQDQHEARAVEIAQHSMLIKKRGNG